MNTPILLITFNRPDHTRQTLQRILEAQPLDLYIFQDGAREGNVNDAIKCQQVRDVISELIGCASLSVGQQTIHCTQDTVRSTIHFYGSTINLGCGAGPMTGISWFFDNVEQGIVMEDDCLAHPDFFPYCEELLNRYKGTEVKFINSTLYDDRWTKALCSPLEEGGGEVSYGYSHYMVTGAWASWSDVWQGFDLDLHSLNAKAFRKKVLELTNNKAEANWWYYAVLEIQKDQSKKSYWDFQMQIHLFQMGAITIHPQKNLISNIGFDAEGTHTWANDGRGDKAIFPIIPLVHPDRIEVNKQLDEYCFAKAHSQGCLKDFVKTIYNNMLWTDGVGHRLLVLYKKIKGTGYNVHRV